MIIIKYLNIENQNPDSKIVLYPANEKNKYKITNLHGII
jgi:hypothetical protein